MGIIIEFLQKPFHIKSMLIRASLDSLHYKRIIHHTEFIQYAAKMGEFRYETPLESLNDPYIEEVRWVIYAIRRWAFWDTKCFDRALTAKKLLNQRGYPCTLYMGLRKDEKGALIAHAWVRCGNTYVSGGSGSGYAVTGIYGDHWPNP